MSDCRERTALLGGDIWVSLVWKITMNLSGISTFLWDYEVSFYFLLIVCITSSELSSSLNNVPVCQVFWGMLGLPQCKKRLARKRLRALLKLTKLPSHKFLVWALCKDPRLCWNVEQVWWAGWNGNAEHLLEVIKAGNRVNKLFITSEFR